MAAKSALIVGATGAVGRYALKELLASPNFSRIGEYGRRVTPKNDIPASHADKLVQKVVDFEKIEDAGLKEGKFDVVVITLGTTRRAAGSLRNFVHIDREYVIAAAQAARVAGLKQRLIYVSAFGARKESYFTYAQSKALTEESLARLGYDDLIILRPGYLAQRGQTSIFVSIFLFCTGILSHFTPHLQIKTAEVGKSILMAATRGSAGLPPLSEMFQAGGKNGVPAYNVVGNKGMLGLATLEG